ncbi:MAG: hypothetical protein OXI24_05535 [Candidatus Poribacteria bacterium]|nr:hypothetical protein [Candidatus Poribacteria bacterium]
MNMIETMKEKTLRLIGLVLITIPLMACYPILLYLGLSVKIAAIVTVCLSGVAYILLVIRIEPFLRKILPFIQTKGQGEFSAAILKRGSVGIEILKGPSSSLITSELDVPFSNTNTVRDLRGNWIHS